MGINFNTLDVREIRIDEDIPKTEYYAGLPAIKQIVRKHGVPLTKPISFFGGENGIKRLSIFRLRRISLKIPTECCEFSWMSVENCGRDCTL